MSKNSASVARSRASRNACWEGGCMVCHRREELDLKQTEETAIGTHRRKHALFFWSCRHFTNPRAICLSLSLQAAAPVAAALCTINEAKASVMPKNRPWRADIFGSVPNGISHIGVMHMFRHGITSIYTIFNSIASILSGLLICFSDPDNGKCPATESLSHH